MRGIIEFQQNCTGHGEPYSIHIESIEAVYQTADGGVYLRTTSADDVLLMSSYKETMEMWETAAQVYQSDTPGREQY